MVITSANFEVSVRCENGLNLKQKESCTFFPFEGGVLGERGSAKALAMGLC